MLTVTHQHAVDQFAKSLTALGDDALIDTYHQAWEDHREASAEGSDNLSKACAKSLTTEKAMLDRFPDYKAATICGIREPALFPVPNVPIAHMTPMCTAMWIEARYPELAAPAPRKQGKEVHPHRRPGIGDWPIRFHRCGEKRAW